MKNIQTLTKIALIAALYSVLSLVLAPLSFGTLQVRVSEALTLLPLIYPPAILGLTLGCFITNLLGAFMGLNILGFMDVVFGTLATLIAAVFTFELRFIQIKKVPILSILSPILINALVIGAELAYVLAPSFSLTMILLFGLDVAIGQSIAVIAFGLPLLSLFKRLNLF
jgi:uncharacterized membrane protein